MSTVYGFECDGCGDTITTDENVVNPVCGDCDDELEAWLQTNASDFDEPNWPW